MGKDNLVGVPSVKGMGSSFKDFGVGAIGGLLFLLAYRFFGPLGLIAAPLLAGSIVKGDRGTIIATMAGFMLFAAGGSLMGTGGNGSGADNDVM